MHLDILYILVHNESNICKRIKTSCSLEPRVDYLRFKNISLQLQNWGKLQTCTHKSQPKREGHLIFPNVKFKKSQRSDVILFYF